MRPWSILIAPLTALLSCVGGQERPAKLPPAAPVVDVQALLMRATA
jgi:hypothetical protein